MVPPITAPIFTPLLELTAPVAPFVTEDTGGTLTTVIFANPGIAERLVPSVDKNVVEGALVTVATSKLESADPVTAKVSNIELGVARRRGIMAV